MILEKWLLFTSESAPASATAGLLYMTGSNPQGQLGDNTTISRSSPVQIGSLSWDSLAIGISHTLAIRSDGLLFAWGDNTYGQLGDAESELSEASLRRSSPVQIGSNSWKSISTFFNTSYAIRSDDKLFAWGSNIFGQTGNNDRLGYFNYTSVEASDNTTLAIRSDGALITWGDNRWGQLGNGTTENNNFPRKIGNSSWIIVSSATSVNGAAGAIRSDGGLFMWGNNSFGCLGNGEITGRSSPVQIGTSSWIKLSIGLSHTAAIRSDGALFTWGLNGNGQLGDNTIISKSSPIQIGTSSWTAVEAGALATYAIRSDGALFVWGSNSDGRLGDAGGGRSSPTQIGTSSWSKITAGDLGTVHAIRSDSALFGWGNNTGGEVGHNIASGDVFSPVQIGTSSWTMVKNSGFHAHAIRSDGRLFGWGRNNQGDVGNGTTTWYSSPVQVGTSSWIMVSNSRAIRTDGNLFAWGSGLESAIPDTSLVSSPVLVASSRIISPVQIGSSSWIKVASGYENAIAIRSGGNLFAWGFNGDNRLGYGLNDITTRSSPVQIGTSTWNDIDGGGEHFIGILNNGHLYAWGRSNVGVWQTSTSATFSWAQMSIGGVHAAAIRSDGALFTWGGGNFGAGGRNSISGSLYPVRVGTSSWSVVSAGTAATGAIRSDGALFTWGNNDAFIAGMLGHGDLINRSSPVQVGTSSWTAVGIADGHMLAIRSDGALFACGNNVFGYLGDNTIVSKSSPVQIGTSSWSKLSAGGNHNLAIRVDGRLFAWGNQTNLGRLGLNNNINYSSPVQVGTSSWTEVSAGTGHSLGIRSDGALFAWGFNNVGQLGDNTRVNRSSPVQIGTSSWAAVAAGFTHSAAITSGNTLFTWGSNGLGELGNNTITNRSSPIQIGTGGNAFKIYASRFNSQRLTATIAPSGALFTWGEGDFAQLGDGSVFNRSAPSQIAGVAESPILISTSSWSKISAGTYHNLAIRNDNRLFGWGDAASKGNNTDNVSVSIITQIGTNTWNFIAGGQNKSFAVDTANNLFVWGIGNSGVFGTNATFLSSPVFLSSNVRIAAVSKFGGTVMHSGFTRKL